MVPSPLRPRQSATGAALLCGIAAAACAVALLGNEQSAFLNSLPAGAAARAGSAALRGSTAGPSAKEAVRAREGGVVFSVGAAAAAALLLTAAGSARRRQTSHSSRTVLQAASLESLNVGDTFDGTVVRDAKIGVYIDIGAEKDALLPRNQVPRGKTYKAGDVIKDLTIFEVQAGDTPATRKIRLTLGKTFQAGDKVTGKVARAMAYGIFFDIGAARDGLCPSKFLSKPIDDYKVGEEVELTVAQVDGDKVTLSAGGSVDAPSASGSAGSIASLSVGQTVDGIVARVNQEYGIFFNIGMERDALCFTAQLDKPLDEYKEGDKVSNLKISNIDRQKERIEVTTRPLASEAKVGEKIEGTVVSVTKAGVFFDAGYASDFLAPISLLSKDIKDYSRGEVADLMVVQVDGQRVSVSTKSEEELGTPLSRLVRGAEITGKVQNVEQTMGLFLDIGAQKDALLRCKGVGAIVPPKPLEEYAKGEEVEGLIITKVDLKAQTVEVTLKGAEQLAPTPSGNSNAMENLKVGQKIDGTVSRVMDFGVFVSVGAERDALYATNQLDKPLSEYKPGDKLEGLNITEVDPVRQRLAVSSKPTAADYEVGQEVTGKVVKIMPFGLFIDFGAAVNGLAPIRLLEKETSEYQVGEELKGLKIAQLDKEQGKILVGQSAGSGRDASGRISIDDLQVGQKVPGVVRMARDYGVFVDIGLGRKDGLMPNAMLPEGKMASEYKSNETIDVWIVKIDPPDRITLSAVEPNEEILSRWSAPSSSTGGGDQGYIPSGRQIPDSKLWAEVINREDFISPEPFPFYEMAKKYPGLIKFPEKEQETIMFALGHGGFTGFSTSKEMMCAETAWLPIPVHLRKPDAGPPVIPEATIEDLPNYANYEYGIKPEIHVKYRCPPLNDPNWVNRPVDTEYKKPLAWEEVVRRAGPYVPISRKEGSTDDRVAKGAWKVRPFGGTHQLTSRPRGM
eukprot:TRINITY_DN327_c0_g1_i1.p1 TRINITY_DN327_c0_g1~~TRINITY_DN327_c0_g1_i1.p1  ORF type:complete len:978 (-),score=231.46 TRINITY_DN327_c0_g1_i1:171-3053(-)